MTMHENKSRNILFVVEKIGHLDIFSIPILSSLVKERGHRTRLLIYQHEKDSLDRVFKEFSPDIVAYSVTSEEADRIFAINRELREFGEFFSLFGGPHPTYFPECVKEPRVDAICRGEADKAFPNFVDAFGTEAMYSVPNFVFRQPDGSVLANDLEPLLEDLDSLPYPDRDLIFVQNPFLAQSPIKTFFAGRGCIYNCSYCFNHVFHKLYKGKGKILRVKSVDYLLGEIESVLAKYPGTFIKFHDDIFGVDKKWLEEFADKYPARINLPFISYARVNFINDWYCGQLARAGCYSMCIAIESGDQGLRETVLNRKMSNESIVAACQTIHKHGMKIYSLNMVGLPQETEEQMVSTARINIEAGVDFADSSIFQPYPGTRITELCIQTGMLDEGFNSFESQFADTILNFPPEQRDKIRTFHRLFPIIVDHPWVLSLYPLLSKIRIVFPALNFMYRFYYGYFLEKRIYMGKIPLRLKAKAAMTVLFSRDRAA